MRFLAPILIAMLLSVHADAQKRRGNQWKRNAGVGELVVAVGIAAGQETWMAFPKVGVYKEFPFSQRKGLRNPRFGFRRNSFYAGGEVSLFVFFAGTFTGGINCGFSLGPVTIDNSLTRTLVADSGGDVTYKYTTYNPKIGLTLGPVWLKAGPSFRVAGNPDWGNWMKMNGTSMNVELLFLLDTGN